MAYSPEMRRDVLEMDDLGAATQEIAIELNVSKTWVRRVKQEFRESGITAPKTTRECKKAWEDHVDWLTQKIQENRICCCVNSLCWLPRSVIGKRPTRDSVRRSGS